MERLPGLFRALYHTFGNDGDDPVHTEFGQLLHHPGVAVTFEEREPDRNCRRGPRDRNRFLDRFQAVGGGQDAKTAGPKPIGGHDSLSRAQPQHLQQVMCLGAVEGRIVDVLHDRLCYDTAGSGWDQRNRERIRPSMPPSPAGATCSPRSSANWRRSSSWASFSPVGV